MNRSGIKHPKACPRCGTEFHPTTAWHKYCSPKCRTEGYKREQTCLECGATFLRPNSLAPKYCSLRCANTVKARPRKGKTGRFGRGVKMGTYPCSAKCGWCRQVYEKKEAKQRYCSQSCNSYARHAKARGAPPGEAAPPPWGLKTKGEDTCRNCGRRARHLHHIVPRSKSKAGHDDWERNGLPLCFDCHMGWHHHTVEVHHDRLTDEEFLFASLHVGVLWLERNYPDRGEVLLMELDERMAHRTLRPDRPETIEERIRRLTEAPEFDVETAA